MRRGLLAFGAVVAAIVAQVTILDNFPFPGGSPPNLVLVVVVALALASGPRQGAVTGFAAGLAADAAPPATHLLGLSALVFCLVGYGCGLMRGPLERSSWLPLAGMAIGAVGGEALYALTGLIFSDPDITWQSARQVLPVSVVYDLLLCPFVLYAVARLGKYGDWGPRFAPSGLLTGKELTGLAPSGAAVLSGLALSGAAVRDTGTGRAPSLRAAGGRRSDAWIGGGQRRPGQQGAQAQRPRPLHLRLRGGVAGSAVQGHANRASPAGLLPTVPLRLGAGRRGDGMISRSPGAGALGGAGGAAVRPGGASRLRGSAFSGGQSTAGAGAKRRSGVPRLRFGGSAFSGGQSTARAGAKRRSGVPRLRFGGSAFSGGQSTARAGAKRRSGVPRLRLRRRQHGGGVVGGGVLGSKKWGGLDGRRQPGKGSFSGAGALGSGQRLPPARAPRAGSFGGGGRARFLTRGKPGGAGQLRSGRSAGAQPRFRSGGRRRFGLGRGRSGVWRIGGKRTGGLR